MKRRNGERALIAGALVIVSAGWLLLRGDKATGPSVAPLSSELTVLDKPTYGKEILEWRLLAWRDANGNIPQGILAQALQDRSEYLHSGLDQNGFGDVPTSHLRWITQGPDNVGGRTRSMIVHPENSDVLWAAATSGGVWKSIDRGGSWVPMNGDLANFVLSCITLDTNPRPSPEPPYQTLYAGTGEGGQGGDGIYQSTDGGTTWAVLPPTRLPQNVLCPNSPWCTVSKVSVMPGNSNILLAATWQGIYLLTYDPNTDDWSTARVTTSDKPSRFVSFDPNDALNAVGDVIEPVPPNFEDAPVAKYSTNGGASWDTATRYQPSPTPFGVVDGHRIEFGYNPDQSSVVYAINHNPSNSNSLAEVSRSDDGGQNFHLMATQVVDPTPIPINAYYWNMAVWASPHYPNTVVVGGNHLYESTDGGNTFTQISAGYIFDGEQPHIDQHCLVSDPQDRQRVYSCNDGGVYRAQNIYDATVSSGWENLSRTYRTSQYSAARGHSAFDGLIFGGTQDNGTIRSTISNHDGMWKISGDGGFTAISPTASSCYGELPGLRIFRASCGLDGGHPIYCGYGANAWCNNPGAREDPLLDALDGRANQIAPFVMDPNEPNRIIAGGVSIWRTNDAQTEPQPRWYCIRGPGGAPCPVPNPSGTPPPPLPGPNASAIAIAPSDSNVIWVGYNDGTIFKTTDGTKSQPTWTAVPSPSAIPTPISSFIPRILIDPDNKETVYVGRGLASANLLKTTTGGNSWADISGPAPESGGLPPVPVRGIARHPDYPNKLYVGLDPMGLYSTVNDGQIWLPELDGPANVSVDEVTFMHGTTRLLAATYGRGVWTAETTQPPNSQQELYDFDGDGRADIGVFRPSEGNWYIFHSMSATTQVIHKGASGDIPAAANFDGDEKTDVCVFRPSNGTWYWKNSSNGADHQFQFGLNGDIPVPADFDGDGIADLAVFRAGMWYLQCSVEGFIAAEWGAADDIPTAADFNGDGRADLNIFRSKEGLWWFYTTNGGWDPYAVQWGLDTDIPTAADFDGDGKADVAVWRPQGSYTGYWFILKSSDETLLAAPFGQSGDKPVQADYDGDGKADFAIWRPAEGDWHLLRSTAGYVGVHYGASGDIPVEQRRP